VYYFDFHSKKKPKKKRERERKKERERRAAEKRPIRLYCNSINHTIQRELKKGTIME